jgi:hypothetical protein
MHQPFMRAVVAAAAVFTLACGDSLAPEDIAGTYEATTMVFTSQADPNTTSDVLAAGYSFTIQFNANGTLETTFAIGGSTDTDSGTYAIDGNDITLDIDGDPATGTIDRSGETLTIVLTTGVEFDFDDNGVDEPATLRLVVERI